jgi:hypothetical protein
VAGVVLTQQTTTLFASMTPTFFLKDRQPLASTRRDQLATAADSGLIVCNGTE